MGWSFNHWIEWLKWAFSKGVRSRKVYFNFLVAKSVLGPVRPIPSVPSLYTSLYWLKQISQIKEFWYSPGFPDHIGARSKAWIISPALGFQSLLTEKEVSVARSFFCVHLQWDKCYTLEFINNQSEPSKRQKLCDCWSFLETLLA